MNRNGFILFLLFFCLFLSPIAAAATRTVTNCADSGAGSLRQALTGLSNSTDIIFNITTAEASYSTGEAYSGLVTSEAAGNSWFRIILNSSLPTISNNNVWVQGSTQPLTESNNPSGPEVEVRMNGTLSIFTISGTGVTLEGLTINRRGGSDGGNGIDLNNAQSCQILGCYIGISATGEGLAPNKNDLGITIYNLSSNNKIGNGTAGGRNIISGTSSSGIYILDAGTTGNQVLGNYIGLNSAGTAAIANSYGINILLGASQNYIGDGTAGGKNIISGNATGVYITGTNTNSNEVLGNYIGTTASGEVALPNSSVGVYTISQASYNKIGKAVSGCGNIISGNGYGVYLASSTNEVLGNYIGLSASGLKLANDTAGVQIAGIRNKIGNGTTLGRNIISGNTNSGILLQGIGLSYYTEIMGNYIGTNVNGTSAITNGSAGIYSNSDRNIIGDGTAGGRNVISGNSGGEGIWFSIGCSNEVYGNYIGLNAAGTASLANGYNGINISGDTAGGAIGNKIGAAGKGNVISGNAMSGIRIYRDTSKAADNTGQTTILANFIGSDASQNPGFGNGRSGVSITSSEGNYIGDGVPGDANLIYSHTHGAADDAGIRIFGSPSKNNYVLGNYIDYNYRGVQLLCSANNNKIGDGTSAGRNHIDQNTQHGMMIHDSGTISNEILGNYIGVLDDGSAYGNTWYGVYIYNGASLNKIGNGTAGGSNVIAFNGNSTYPDGIRIEGSSTINNKITQNSIYSNNGKGIKLISGGNQEVASPEITSAGYNQLTGLTQISGTASGEPNGTVEIFKAQLNQGKTYLSSTTANASGIWSVSYSNLISGDVVVATGTTANPDTSEFSASREVTTSVFKQYQPDNMIGSLDTGADYVGEGIFNADGTNQTKTKSFTCGDSATFYVKVKNAGNMTDYAIITGTGSLGSWAITYYDAKTGGSDITSQITGSGWASGSLASTETKEIRVVANYSGTISATKEILVTSTSSVDGVTKDVVKAVVQAQAVVALDHFAVTAPASAIAGCAFSLTVTGKDSSNNTVSSISGTTSLSVETGTIGPTSIDSSAFSAGAWTGNITLSALGNRTVTVTNGSATGSAIILVGNATREYTSTELGIAGMSITIPAGAVTVEVTISASEVNSPADPPSGYKIGGKVFNLVCTPSSTFLLPVTVTIPIEGPLKAPRLYYWTGTEWSSSGITVISNTSTSLTFTTSHFTTFASFGALPANLVRFGPNPYNPNNGSGRFWYWLDADAETSIYLIDLGGTIVWKQSYSSSQNGGRSGENNIEFKGQTAWGDLLGNGVYLYKIVQSGKSIGGGKIAVIK